MTPDKSCVKGLLAACLVASCTVFYEVLWPCISARITYDGFNQDQWDVDVYTVPKSKPVPVEICPGIMARSEYAIVSMLTLSNTAPRYLQALSKQAHAMQRFTRLDALLLVVDPSNYSNRSIPDVLAPWQPCRVKTIQGPAFTVLESNRFLDAKVYSKLWIWRLSEYQAVLFIDADTLFVRQFSGVFIQELPSMLRSGRTVGMATNNLLRNDDFNAGVILVKPDTKEFENLIHNISIVKHDVGLAEQNYLNEYYRDCIHTLPLKYNSLVNRKTEFPSLWRQLEPNLITLHYTCKPWDHFTCFVEGIQDLCLLWYWMF